MTERPIDYAIRAVKSQIDEIELRLSELRETLGDMEASRAPSPVCWPMTFQDGHTVEGGYG